MPVYQMREILRLATKEWSRLTYWSTFGGGKKKSRSLYFSPIGLSSENVSNDETRLVWGGRWTRGEGWKDTAKGQEWVLWRFDRGREVGQSKSPGRERRQRVCGRNQRLERLKPLNWGVLAANVRRCERKEKKNARKKAKTVFLKEPATRERLRYESGKGK